MLKKLDELDVGVLMFVVELCLVIVVCRVLSILLGFDVINFGLMIKKFFMYKLWLLVLLKLFGFVINSLENKLFCGLFFIVWRFMFELMFLCLLFVLL